MPGSLAKGYILDTSPLLDYLILCFRHDQPRSTWLEWKLHPDFQTSGTRADGLLELLHRHRGFLATSIGVIMEVVSHVHEAARSNKKSVLQFQEIALHELGELTIMAEAAVVRGNPEALAQIGIVDTTLLEMGKKRQREHRQWIVLTSDERTLRRRCTEEGVSVALASDEVDGFLHGGAQ